MREWVPTGTTILPGNRLVDEPPNPVWEEMPRLAFLNLCVHMRKLADNIGLRAWRLHLDWEPADDSEEHEDVWARCQVKDQLTSTTIWVCRAFLSLHDFERQRALVHELIHAHLDALYNIGDQTQRNYWPRPLYELFSEEFHRQIERITDLMAAPWADVLPPIPTTIPSDGFMIQLQDGREMPLTDYLEIKES